MPVRRLPSNPSLDYLKHQAKELLKAHAAHNPAAAQRIREFHPRYHSSTDAQIFASVFKLADAQLTIAREAGFPSWTRLKRRIEKPTSADKLELPYHKRIEDPIFRRAVDLVDTGNTTALREHLRQHPKLAGQRVLFEGGNYFRNPTLLEFIAENPIRHGALPGNIVEVAKVILDAGPNAEMQLDALNETLALVCTGSVARESGQQIPLIELLCDPKSNPRADPDSAIQAAALHGEMQAVDALLRRGARLTLPLAAALGRVDDFRRLFPGSNAETRHLALAMASQHGHVEIVRVLLDAGEDPNRYHPPGGHSHCTPLHQAALEGNIELARLLIERGARLDMEDVLFHGTPAGWAHHAGKTEMEAFLRAEQERELAKREKKE